MAQEIIVAGASSLEREAAANVALDGGTRRACNNPDCDKDWPCPIHDKKPPRHAFEVTIQIGGDDWEYVLRTIRELSYHLEEHGPDCSLTSGGAGGSHYVAIEKRDISPEAYRKELQQWFQAQKAKLE